MKEFHEEVIETPIEEKAEELITEELSVAEEVPQGSEPEAENIQLTD